ncbi:MAG: hypothetical protein EOM67_06505 [Spirochaetia bacterium]|nr:hypothetical protein [Spirochaetia bacterium]
MKKLTSLLLLLLLTFSVAYGRGWVGGYRVSLSGYMSDSISKQEHLSVDLLYSPIINENMTLSLYGGYSFSNLFYPSVTQTLKGGLSFSFLLSQKHLLEPLFVRDTALFATLDIGLMSALSSFSPTFITASISPFTLFFGDMFISMSSLLVTYEIGSREFSYGIKLFELTHYLW